MPSSSPQPKQVVSLLTFGSIFLVLPGGRFLSAKSPDRVSKRHPIESRGDSPSIVSNSRVMINLRDIHTALKYFFCFRSSL